MLKRFFFTILFFAGLQASAQDTTETRKLRDIVDVNGYLKYLHSANFVNEGMLTYNLLHNRLNIGADWKSLSFKSGIRTRLFYGDQVVYTPGFSDMLEVDDGFFDMSFVWAESSTVLAHTMIDRLYLNWASGNTEITVGRQRINWGMTLAWNANDLFNTYNFVDFDYEERPGNDAIRFQRYLQGGMAVFDAAYKPGRTADETIAALRYRFNKKGYDIQFIGGWYNTDIAIGAGWAGNIKTSGFKGEGTYFIPRHADTSGVLSLSASWDYSFKNGMYINVSGLYNSDGIKDASQLQAATAFSDISARRLMPTTWSGFVQASYPVSPILNASLAAIYGSDIHLLFLMPTIAYSLSNNWDLSLVGQIYFVEVADRYRNAGNSIFMRVKWSF